jgi:hypothetical protein
VAQARAQDENQVKRGADEIRAEAAPHNAAEAKIETMLLLATRPPDTAMAAAAPKLHINPAHDAQGRIQLDITAQISPQLLKAVEDLGGAVVFTPTDPAAHGMRAWLPLRAVATLAARSDVYFVRTVLPARHNQTPASPADAEGDIAHAADVARTSFPGARGGGVKIGVLSDSIDDSYGSLNAAPPGVVPDTLHILNRQAGSGKGEGLAMVEIIHRLAPDAEIYFATSNGGPDSMASNILRLEASGCRIIVGHHLCPGVAVSGFGRQQGCQPGRRYRRALFLVSRGRRQQGVRDIEHIRGQLLTCLDESLVCSACLRAASG